MATPPEDSLGERYVNIPWPSGTHQRSIVTFRGHAVATMLCMACEQVWTEPTSHPEIHAIKVDVDKRP